MSNIRLPSDGHQTPTVGVPSAHSDTPAVTRGDIARRMPPAEMQAHVQAYVRIGGLPRPTAFHADKHGTLFLIFLDRDTAAVDRWVTELGMCRPRVSEWGFYVAWTAPEAWYGWTVIARCDIANYAPRIHVIRYGDTIEARGPVPPGGNPANGMLLGVAKHRHHYPDQDDYMVVLRGGEGHATVPDEDTAMHALVTGQIPGGVR